MDERERQRRCRAQRRSARDEHLEPARDGPAEVATPPRQESELAVVGDGGGPARRDRCDHERGARDVGCHAPASPCNVFELQRKTDEILDAALALSRASLEGARAELGRLWMARAGIARAP